LFWKLELTRTPDYSYPKHEAGDFEVHVRSSNPMRADAIICHTVAGEVFVFGCLCL